jgi:hypothetical protein
MRCGGRIRAMCGVFLVIGLGVATCWANDSPRLFGPGVISGPADDLSPTFSPDGKTVYFTRRNPSGSTILTSSLVNDRWTEPKVASFSGAWRDLEPAMSPDGSYLVFTSNRSAIAGGKPIDGNFHKTVLPALGGNLWRVNRSASGWSEPYRLPDTINRGTTFSPSVSSDGSLYFMRPDDVTGYFHLYRSRFEEDSYRVAERLAIGDDTTEDVDPAVAPDQSFLVYSSKHPEKNDQQRLFIVFRENKGWGKPIDLGDEVNEGGDNIEARLGADHRTLYFSTNTVPPMSFPRSPEQNRRDLEEMQVWANGRQNIWYVSLASWLDRKPRT